MAAKKKSSDSTLRAQNSAPAAESEVEEPPGSRRLTAPPAGRGAKSALLESPAIPLHLDILPEPAAPAETRRPARPRREPPARRTPSLNQIEVLVLYSQALGMRRGRPEDVVADEETEEVARLVAAELEGRVAAAHLAGVWDNLKAALKPFDPKKTVVFNLIESLGGQAYTDYLAPRLFHRLGFRFTGAPSEALRVSGNKLLAKKVFEANGLATPRYQIARKPGVRRFDVPLPAIVKPAQEGGSLGITQDAIVHDPKALDERVQFILETYRQPALVEEYIAGRELNVAIWGGATPQVLPISEIDFQWTDDPYQKIVSFASKWEKGSIEYSQTPGVCPAPLNAVSRKRVESAALKAYRLLGVQGYCRVDVRLRDGIPYLLEVNANPDLAPDAGFFRSARTAGHSHESMVARILEFSLEQPLRVTAAKPVQLSLNLAVAPAA